MKKPNRIDTVCINNNYLQGLIKRAQWLNQLNILLQQTVPASFSAHCQLANVHDDVLIIHTENAAHASLLRFQTKTICRTFSNHCHTQFNKLEVRVRPLTTEAVQRVTTNNLNLPEQAADALKMTATSIGESALKQSLNKLAERVK